MRKRPSKSIPAVTWVTLQPESSARTSLKSVDEYLSEVQDDPPKPPRRLCLSPETLNALENAERLVENAERQLSKMNFNSIITEELESERFNGKANEEEKIYIRNVVASTLKKGFYDPASSAALADHLKPKAHAARERYHYSRPPSRICGFPPTPKERPAIEPGRPAPRDCRVCASSRDCRAAAEGPRNPGPPGSPAGTAGEGEPPGRLSVHRAPDVSIKAELAVRTVEIVDIRPGEFAARPEPRENVATFVVRHESARPGPEAPGEAEAPAAKPRAPNARETKVREEKLRHLKSPIEKHRRHRRRREKVLINDIPIGELSLTEPRILADIDSLLGRQREVIRQLDRFDKFLASKLPGELSASNELEPPVKLATPLVASSETNDRCRANLRFRKPEDLEEKSRRTVETSESCENGSTTSEEEEIAMVDYTESFESASSDAGFVENQREANLDAGVCEESQETNNEGAASQAASDVNVEVNIEVEVDEESIEEDKDGGATEKLHGSSQKTSHLIDSIPDTLPDKASEVSDNSLKLSTVSANVESTESKIESRISEVRGNLDSLLRSIGGSERANDAAAKTSVEIPKSAVVSAESRGDLDRNYRASDKSLSQSERVNEVLDKKVEIADLINELSKGSSRSEKSASQSSQSDGVVKSSRSKSKDSQNDLMKQFPPLNEGTKTPARGDNTNRSECDQAGAKSQSATLDDISGLLEVSLEIDAFGEIVTDKLEGKSDRIEAQVNSRSNEFIDQSENLIVGKAQAKPSSIVNQIPRTMKALTNDLVEMRGDSRNSQEENQRPKGVGKSFEAPIRFDLIDRSDHRHDKMQKKQPIILDKINAIDRESNLSNTRSLMTLLEENSEEVRDSFQQQKLTLLKILESCSIPSRHQGKRVFTSTVLGELEPPSSFARLKESSHSESSSDTYSEGEVRFSSSTTTHSVGEICRKNEFSKSSSLAKTTSSGSCNPSISLSRSAGEISEIAMDSLR